MELIPVGDNKLKIMLTLSDMTRFEIPDGVPDVPCEQIRLAFREILNEASSITGFNTSGDRLYVQYYPSKKGGCELFVTKLGRPGQNDGQSPAFPTGSTVGLAEPAVCPPRTAPTASTESQLIPLKMFPYCYPLAIGFLHRGTAATAARGRTKTGTYICSCTECADCGSVSMIPMPFFRNTARRKTRIPCFFT